MPEVPMSERPRPEAVVDIRYGQVGLVQVRVHTTDPGAILDELTGRVATAPHFFRRTGVCLDLSSLEQVPEVAQLRSVIDALRRAGMLAVGLSGDAEALAVVSAALALPVLTSLRSPARRVPVVQPATPAHESSAVQMPDTAGAAALNRTEPGRLSAAAAAASMLGVETGAVAAAGAAAAGGAVAATSAAAATSEPCQSALIHAQTVRSGQRLYGRNRDLIVTASVGAGAEIVADGCVHIYGALRGRAMAGAHGQLGARVFCQEFYAELVSIAGIFRVFETIPPELAGAPVQAWLVGEDLRFARIG